MPKQDRAKIEAALKRAAHTAVSGPKDAQAGRLLGPSKPRAIVAARAKKKA